MKSIIMRGVVRNSISTSILFVAMLSKRHSISLVNTVIEIVIQNNTWFYFNNNTEVISFFSLLKRSLRFMWYLGRLFVACTEKIELHPEFTMFWSRHWFDLMHQWNFSQHHIVDRWYIPVDDGAMMQCILQIKTLRFLILEPRFVMTILLRFSAIEETFSRPELYSSSSSPILWPARKKVHFYPRYLVDVWFHRSWRCRFVNAKHVLKATTTTTTQQRWHHSFSLSIDSLMHGWWLNGFAFFLAVPVDTYEQRTKERTSEEGRRQGHTQKSIAFDQRWIRTRWTWWRKRWTLELSTWTIKYSMMRVLCDLWIQSLFQSLKHGYSSGYAASRSMLIISEYLVIFECLKDRWWQYMVQVENRWHSELLSRSWERKWWPTRTLMDFLFHTAKICSRARSRKNLGKKGFRSQENRTWLSITWFETYRWGRNQ